MTPTEGTSLSLFLPDQCINPGHPRFKTLTSNIRHRRGEKVAINLPSEWLELLNVIALLDLFLEGCYVQQTLQGLNSSV